MTVVVLLGDIGGEPQYLTAEPGRYDASPRLWAEIEMALQYGEVVSIGAEPGEPRTVSLQDPETLAAVACDLPGMVIDRLYSDAPDLMAEAVVPGAAS